MDITPFLDLKIAPRHVFERLQQLKDRPRFYVPEKSDGGAPTYRTVTWGAFADEIREIALYLHAILSPGDRAAIYAPNRVEWASAALAIQAAAGVMVPIYPASTATQAAYVAKHSDAKVVFVDTPALLARLYAIWDDLAGVQAIVLLDDGLDPLRVRASAVEKGQKAPTEGQIAERVIPFGKARAIGAQEHAADPKAFERTMNAVSLDQPALMLYTSGTSGNPKGVPLTHGNIGANGRDWITCNAPLLELDTEVDILWLPMSHIFGFGEMCLGNSFGWTTYLSDPASCLARLPEIRPTVFMSVPSHWEKLAVSAMYEPTDEAKRAKFREVTGGRLKFCLSGGAGLKREVKDFFHANDTLVVEGYGLTETSPTLTLNRPDAYRFDSVGKPLPSVQIKLAEDGEILAKGPNVFGGYHKDPVATKEAFTDDGWFKTGDVGRFTEDGFLQIVDRKKDILVTAGGKNVPPANIEMRFADDPYVAHAVVYGEGKKFLVVGLWPNEEAVTRRLEGIAEPERAAARQKLFEESVTRANESLASYESLKKFVVLDTPLTVESELLTPSLKIRRKKIYERFKPSFEALYDQGKP